MTIRNTPMKISTVFLMVFLYFVFVGCAVGQEDEGRALAPFRRAVLKNLSHHHFFIPHIQLTIYLRQGICVFNIEVATRGSTGDNCQVTKIRLALKGALQD